jgi:hypothetical protein
MKTCGECPFWEYMSGDTGKCNAELESRICYPYRSDPICQSFKLLSACHRQRDRAIRAEKELDRATPYLKLHGWKWSFEK